MWYVETTGETKAAPWLGRRGSTKHRGWDQDRAGTWQERTPSLMASAEFPFLLTVPTIDFSPYNFHKCGIVSVALDIFICKYRSAVFPESQTSISQLPKLPFAGWATAQLGLLPYITQGPYRTSVYVKGVRLGTKVACRMPTSPTKPGTNLNPIAKPFSKPNLLDISRVV